MNWDKHREELADQLWKVEKLVTEELNMPLISKPYKSALLKILVAIVDAQVFVCKA